MKICRTSFWVKLAVLISGITFLNMSFILSELDALGLKNNFKSAQNIVNSISEEEEQSGEPEEDCESEMFLATYADFSKLAFTSLKPRHSNTLHDNQSVLSAHRKNFSPPPEQSPLV